MVNRTLGRVYYATFVPFIQETEVVLVNKDRNNVYVVAFPALEGHHGAVEVQSLAGMVVPVIFKCVSSLPTIRKTPHSGRDFATFGSSFDLATLQSAVPGDLTPVESSDDSGDEEVPRLDVALSPSGLDNIDRTQYGGANPIPYGSNASHGHSVREPARQTAPRDPLTGSDRAGAPSQGRSDFGDGAPGGLPAPSPDIMDQILGRMRAADTSSRVVKSGNVFGAGRKAAAAVSPPDADGAVDEEDGLAPLPPSVSHNLHRACAYLHEQVGAPPLRCEPDRFAPELTIALLTTHQTFTKFVQAHTLKGAQLREALTHARVLDLEVSRVGAKHIRTPAAEVQLRRLFAIVLASSHGGYHMASALEEIPDGSVVAEIPEGIMRRLETRMAAHQKFLSHANPKGGN